MRKGHTKIPTIKREKIVPYLASATLLFSGFLVFIVYRSFTWSLFIALLLYSGFEKQNRRIYRISGKRKTITAIVSTLLVVIVVVGPIVLLGRSLIIELIGIAITVRGMMTFENVLHFVQRFPALLSFITSNEFFWVTEQESYYKIYSSYGEYFDPDRIGYWIENAYSILLGSMTYVLNFAVNLFFGLLLLFFMFRDGPRLARATIAALPFPDVIVSDFILQIREMILAVLKGSVFVSIIQGFMLGLGLFISGIPNSVLYGTVGAIFSLIPVIGTAVVWLPAALYLGFIANSYGNAIFLSIYGPGMYLFLENILKPRMLDSKLGIHSLFLFLSIIGGITEFGFTGIILGPLFVAVFAALWNIYHIWDTDSNDQNSEENDLAL